MWSLWRILCTGNLYRLNLEVKFFYKKKQIPNERLCGPHLECVSHWQGVWLYVETSINMKFCNANDILYDKWNKKLDNTHNLNTKHKTTDTQTNNFYTCINNVTKSII